MLLLGKTLVKLRYRSAKLVQGSVSMDAHRADVTVMTASSPHARRVRSISRQGPVPDSGGKSTESMQAPLPSSPETSFTVPWFARRVVDRPVRTFRWYGTPATNLRIAPSATRSVRGSDAAGVGCVTGGVGVACGATRANEGDGAGADCGRASCVATGACAERGAVVTFVDCRDVSPTITAMT